MMHLTEMDMDKVWICKMQMNPVSFSNSRAVLKAITSWVGQTSKQKSWVGGLVIWWIGDLVVWWFDGLVVSGGWVVWAAP
jgi:hypothetical protein